MPAYIARELSQLVFEQNFMRGETIYAQNDQPSDHLYFVLEGKLKQEVQLPIVQQVTIPISSRVRECLTKTFDIVYQSAVFTSHQWFGLEEFVDSIQTDLIQKRAVSVVAATNSRLLYVRKQDFLKVFDQKYLSKVTTQV
jgi:CRP-like cAMP-binding protein